ncbi:MAG: hypothetical protein A2133_06060 [Actinobacteria bacterium RBG_16_64_13]|nr:MAG: hypothetical protein A2133_06060 [Actinobacteria bacterium RBG_16_64_13]
MTEDVLSCRPPRSGGQGFVLRRPPGTQAKAVLAALLRIGWRVERQSGSHRVLTRPGWPNLVFAFHDREELGPRMLARVAKHSGLRPEDL